MAEHSRKPPGACKRFWSVARGPRSWFSGSAARSRRPASERARSHEAGDGAHATDPVYGARVRFLEFAGFAGWTAAASLAGAAASGCGGIAVVPDDGSGGTSTTTSTLDPTLGCELGQADCNGSADDGCEVDLGSDPASCGSCGHDCQGGACQTAVCQPVVVATGQSYAYRLAATETSLYWTRSDGSVLRAHEGGEPEIIASGQSAPGDIAVNGTHVYWTNLGDGTIARAPLEGTGAEVVLSGLVQPWSLAVSETWLTWADNATGEVSVLPLGAGGAPSVIAVTEGAWSVALDATHVYWTTLFNASIFAWPLAGGETQTLASDLLSAADLTLSGDRLFFGTASDAGVFTVPVSGGAAVALTQKGGFGMAADAQHVYFGEYDGRLSRVPVGGGETEVLGLAPATPSDVALTSKSVYWASASADGIIMKVAK